MAAVLASFSYFLLLKDSFTICSWGCPGHNCEGGKIWQQSPLPPVFPPACQHPRGSCPRGHQSLNSECPFLGGFALPGDHPVPRQCFQHEGVCMATWPWREHGQEQSQRNQRARSEPRERLCLGGYVSPGFLGLRWLHPF